MFIMLTSSDIISLFNTSQESYSPIVVPPIDDDIVLLCKAILTTLYSIYLWSDADCLSRLILTNVAHKRSLGTAVRFNPMIGAFKSYDPSIHDDAKNGIQNKMEQEWAARIAAQLLIRACKMGCQSFILNTVKYTWVQRL